MSVVAGITTSIDGYITGPDDGPGQGLGDACFIRRQAEHAERYRHRLVQQLDKLGHKVTLEPLPQAA